MYLKQKTSVFYVSYYFWLQGNHFNPKFWFDLNESNNISFVVIDLFLIYF